MLAQQLAEPARPAEIVYLDLSRASRRIAEARAAVARPRQYPLSHRLAARSAGHGSRPASTTSIAAACCITWRIPPPGSRRSQARHGARGRHGPHALWRAGPHRASIDAQEMLRLLAPASEPAPTAHRARQAPAGRAAGDQLAAAQPGRRRDWRRRRCRRCIDLLLHARDRAYRVPEIAALVARRGPGDRLLHRSLALRSRQLSHRCRS